MDESVKKRWTTWGRHIAASDLEALCQTWGCSDCSAEHIADGIETHIDANPEDCPTGHEKSVALNGAAEFYVELAEQLRLRAARLP